MNRKTDFGQVIENLKKLRAMLPAGYMDSIAKKFNVTPATVSNALQGRTRRFDIIEYAVELAEKNKRITDRLEEVVNS